MTDAERDELIEKSLLKELDALTEARVQELRREDDTFRQEYDFQSTLIQQVQLNRREELLQMFAGFEAEQASTDLSQDTIPIFPLPDHHIISNDPKVVPLFKRTWIRVAALLIISALIGAVVWRQLASYDPLPIADDHRDSTKTQLPKDTLRNKSIESPTQPIPQPQGPVAHQPRKPARLQGTVQLPYYETNDVGLGFGKGQTTQNYRPVKFTIGSQPAYEFVDTLKIYLPAIPTARPVWSLVYNRSTDTYYLITGKTRYEIVKGLQGKQPLKIVN